MPIQNVEIAEVFNHVADILEIQGANPFRVRAYRNAARIVNGWPENLADLVEQEEGLPKIAGIGQDLSGKIGEIVRTGRLPLLEDIRKSVPSGLLELLRIPGLGPKRVKGLQDRLGIRNLSDLRKAAEGRRIRELSGFGAKSEERILQELERVGRTLQAPARMWLATAGMVAAPLLRYLRSVPGVREAVVAGSFRRRLETVGDLDILVTGSSSAPVMDRFVEYEDVAEVLSHGRTRSTVRFRSGIQVDVRFVPEASYGAALHYFTGSKAHNIAIRSLGIRRGLKINEYGIFKGARRLGGRKEEEVFRSVGLPYIEPELRENRGEIEAAREGRLPRLIALSDIRGDLHAHTNETDGRLSLVEMAEAAKKRGYEYLAITDHSRHLTVASGLDPKRLKRQIRQIDKLNERLSGIRILKAIEVDILEDGSLDLPEEILQELDLTVCSIHSHFELSRARQTLRVLRAMDQPRFNVLGHPTGRLIGSRKPYELDVERVLNAARERGCAIELNAQPERLDLTDTYCKLTKAIGVKVVISTDAHSDQDLDFMRYGVDQARRGWLEAPDVLNTRPLRELRRLLKRK